jgi:hypothetical protein
MADLQICRTCGVQFSTPSIQDLNNECPICLDPRQYVPPAGQSWTTLSTFRSEGKHKNIFHPMDADQTSFARLLAIRTEPQLAIGQSAYLVRTPEGNVLWDCITYLDDETVEAIKAYGGLKAIVISHPHFFSTHIEYSLLQTSSDVDGRKLSIVPLTSLLRKMNGLCARTRASNDVGQAKSKRSFRISQ